jgi:hypothetical protein
MACAQLWCGSIFLKNLLQHKTCCTYNSQPALSVWPDRRMQVVLNLHGHFDSVTSSGFALGWALDADLPLRPLAISILSDGDEVAAALANCYREDLAEAGHGAGWCAFRARLALPPNEAQQRTLVLVESVSRTVIHIPTPLKYEEDSAPAITSLSDLLASDPTLLGPLDRLQGCRPVFETYIDRRGIESFVRAAYVYMLGRPADTEGIVTYARLLRQAMLEPVDVLLALSESNEFRGRAHMLSAPNTPAFPFNPD